MGKNRSEVIKSGHGGDAHLSSLPQQVVLAVFAELFIMCGTDKSRLKFILPQLGQLAGFLHIVIYYSDFDRDENNPIISGSSGLGFT